nr:MAG TPA: hypothetical protein [Caudoviricetes sp.]
MKKYTSTIAAFLLIIAAIVNIRCESYLSKVTIDKRDKAERQAQFQYYLHINSRQYKQSLKMDTLFALRLDSIDKVNKNCRVHCRK